MTDAYSHSETLVSTEWVAEHADDPSVSVVEINTDPESDYKIGHVPGAIGWGLHTDLEDSVRRDIPGVTAIEALLTRSGIGNYTTVVLYGDGNNRSATWAFWVLKYYRHADVRIMNGGRQRWLDEGRPITTEAPEPEPSVYRGGAPDKSLRAHRDYILSNLGRDSFKPLDTRTGEEYRGELVSSPGSDQSGIYRKGRIPGAAHVPWDEGAAEDGRFLPVEELRRIFDVAGLNPSDEVVPYCRLGVRASYSWFVLKYLLGYERVRNYDGSWTEWGNSTGVPIETDEGQ